MYAVQCTTLYLGELWKGKSVHLHLPPPPSSTLTLFNPPPPTVHPLPYLSPPLAQVELDGGVGVDGQPLVGVDGDTEQPRVGLSKIRCLSSSEQ